MDPSALLTAWYQTQCDGHWEITRRVTMESLDTPCWLVTIGLEGTPLEDRAMPKIEMDVSREDWLVCEVSRKQFRGLGKLPAIVRIFQVLAESGS